MKRLGNKHLYLYFHSIMLKRIVRTSPCGNHSMKCKAVYLRCLELWFNADSNVVSMFPGLTSMMVTGITARITLLIFKSAFCTSMKMMLTIWREKLLM